MSNVIDLFGDRNKRSAPPVSVEDHARNCAEDISENWERFARNNRLNDYFLSCVPMWVNPQVNYLSDLTSVSSLETKIQLNVMVNAPGTCDSAALGWIASFNIQGVHVETPVMMCEAYARCFNILLFLKLSRTLQQANS
jgi:hypothetical protein